LLCSSQLGNFCVFKYGVHKRFLERGIAERGVFFLEVTEKIRQSVATVFSKDFDILKIVYVFGLKSITVVDTYGRF